MKSTHIYSHKYLSQALPEVIVGGGTTVTAGVVLSIAKNLVEIVGAVVDDEEVETPKDLVVDLGLNSVEDLINNIALETAEGLVEYIELETVEDLSLK